MHANHSIPFHQRADSKHEMTGASPWTLFLGFDGLRRHHARRFNQVSKIGQILLIRMLQSTVIFVDLPSRAASHGDAGYRPRTVDGDSGAMASPSTVMSAARAFRKAGTALLTFHRRSDFADLGHQYVSTCSKTPRWPPASGRGIAAVLLRRYTYAAQGVGCYARNRGEVWRLRLRPCPFSYLQGE